MSHRRIKQYKEEFIRIFERAPEGAEWKYWKRLRQKSSVPKLSDDQITKHRLSFNLAIKRLENKKRFLDNRAVKEVSVLPDIDEGSIKIINHKTWWERIRGILTKMKSIFF